ncbi:hypothetical protein QJS04_geneDACA012170 [Acorus gramineus]|uniref:Survival motor neuron protein n=1 Tax=Acorus gramineus TaxID=55184 RepID=A0AAV9BCK1_ACOGR|nr:hypothetical protein QJS04_geneDACA012170 [Acorus gramineus]
MSKYKAMHGKASSSNLAEGEENVPNPVEDTEGIFEHEKKSNSVEQTEGSLVDDGVAREFATDQLSSSVLPPVQETYEAYYGSQGGVEYEQLLSRYYELEGLRQNVLQQLQQSSSYQAMNQCSDFQTQQLPTDSASYNASIPSCCTCSVSPCFLVPTSAACAQHSSGTQNVNSCLACTSSYNGWIPSCSPCLSHCAIAPSFVPSCALGKQGVADNISHSVSPKHNSDAVKRSNVADESVVKTAMMAAERAICSMKLDGSEIPGTSEGHDKEKQNIDLETDLSSVLSAWYSAGFYTGKYLMGQSGRRGHK